MYTNDYYQRREEEMDKIDEAIACETIEIFNRDLDMLNKKNKFGSRYQTEAGYNMWEVINEFEMFMFKDLADLFIKGDTQAIGEALSHAITETMMKKAQQEAEDQYARR